MKLLGQRKNILLKCTRCGHPKRCHIDNEHGNSLPLKYWLLYSTLTAKTFPLEVCVAQ